MMGYGRMYDGVWENVWDKVEQNIEVVARRISINRRKGFVGLSS